jgi:hypothetical protein
MWLDNNNTSKNNNHYYYGYYAIDNNGIVRRAHFALASATAMRTSRCCAASNTACASLSREPQHCMHTSSNERLLSTSASAPAQVYVHCTAGLGRAPGACIAYMFWFGQGTLHEAYDQLTTIRPCGPKKDAIRGATFDLMDDRPWDDFFGLPEFAFTELNDSDRERIRRGVYEGQNPPPQNWP